MYLSFSVMQLLYLLPLSLFISPPSGSLLCPLASCPFSFCFFSSHSTYLVLAWAPSLFSLLPASDIQTLPRVYFFDSYATIQANGSDSRFLSSSVCHADNAHSHLRFHYSFVFCLKHRFIVVRLFSLYLCCSVICF